MHLSPFYRDLLRRVRDRPQMIWGHMDRGELLGRGLIEEIGPYLYRITEAGRRAIERNDPHPQMPEL